MNPNEPIPPEAAEGLREDWVFVQRLDADGNRYDDMEQRREVTLSAEGAVVQKVWANEREYGCGHDARRPRGGRCGEPGCYRDSCAECYTRCSDCRVGLCLYHARHVTTESGQKIPMCSHCRDAQRRRRFWRRFWAVVLSPFITLNDSQK